MDRLTSKDPISGANMIAVSEEWGVSTCGDRIKLDGCIADRLAAYEDTGLSPEEIAALIADNKLLHELVDALEKILGGKNVQQNHSDGSYR